MPVVLGAATNMVNERRVAIIVRFGLNPRRWADRHALGEVVDETPYAYHLAERWFAVDWSNDHEESSAARWWRMSIRRVLGFDFVHVWRNRRIIRTADAVWTHTEREHLAVAAQASPFLDALDLPARLVTTAPGVPVAAIGAALAGHPAPTVALRSTGVAAPPVPPVTVAGDGRPPTPTIAGGA